MANIIPTNILDWSNAVEGSMNIDKIVDFTGLLKDNERSIIFNPCITHYMNDLYICAYRYRTYNVDISDFKELAKNNYANPNHPWRSNWGGRFSDPGGLDNMTGANAEIGKEDSTKFAMLRITHDKDIELVKKYEDYFNDINLDPSLSATGPNRTAWDFSANDLNIQLRNMNPIQNFVDIIKNRHKYIRLEDCRIVKTPVDNLFFLIGNIWTTHQYTTYRRDQENFYNPNEQEQKCNNNTCGQIYIWPVRIDPSTLKLYTLSREPQLLCPDWAAARIEKNWSLYVTRGNDPLLNIQVTYQLTEKFNGHEWITLTFNRNNNTFSNCNNAVIYRSPLTRETSSRQQSISFFGLIERIYNNNARVIHISTTTSTIDYNERELLGVGHVKLHTQNCINQYLNTPLGQFTRLVENQIGNLHSTYIYLFFFYTLSKNTKQLRRFSKFHIPSLSDVALIFPTGLTTLNDNNDDFCVSFGGQGDNSCEALFLSREQIEQSLFDIDFDIFNNTHIYDQIRLYNQIRYSEDNQMHTEDIRNAIDSSLINVAINRCLFTFTRWNDNNINKIVLI